MTTLYLVRHGRTMANLEGRFAGRIDEPLIEEGVAQAAAAGRLLAHEDIKTVYASPMLRTVQTAAIMAEFFGAEVVQDEGLAEINIPHWDGRLKDELMQDYGSGYPLWKEAPDRFCLKGAEGLSDVTQRARRCVEKIMARHQGSSVAAVTHLAVMRCLILCYAGRPLSDYRRVEVGNADPLALIQKDDQIYIRNLSAGGC
jgi:broad specificity phosphatase PhoE